MFQNKRKRNFSEFLENNPKQTIYEALHSSPPKISLTILSQLHFSFHLSHLRIKIPSENFVNQFAEMFRSNLLLSRSPAVPMFYRGFCQPRGKCYIIKTKNGSKEFVYESDILKNLHEKNPCGKVVGGSTPATVAEARTSWERLIVMARMILEKSRRQSMNIAQALKIQEKIVAMRGASIAKLRSKLGEVKELVTVEQLKKVPGRLKGTWQTVKASEAYETVIRTPNIIAEYYPVAASKVRHYWIIFMQSKYKDQLVDVAMWIWINGKKYGQKLTKFIYEAYFEKPQPLAIKRGSKH